MRALLFAAEAVLGSALLAQTPPLGLDRYVPAPAANPITAEKVELGRKLFNDRRMSRDGTIACADCHRADHGFSDDKPLATGVNGRKGKRRTPSIINRAWGSSFFWDGRAATLEDQVLQPVLNPLEMDLKPGEIETRTGLPAADVANALATFVRTIFSGNSRYDRYVAGEQSALNEAERRGMALFRGKANCVSCHVGPNLTDERFHNTGVGSDDGGRFEVTRNTAEKGAFRTPTLRDVAKRPPYMHDGSLATLEDVIRYYDEGGRTNENLDQEIRPLGLNDQEKRDLLAFLLALNGSR